MILTRIELAKIDRRLDEILELLDDCDTDRDADVIVELETEIDALTAVLTKSYRLARIKEIGLRAVGQD